MLSDLGFAQVHMGTIGIAPLMDSYTIQYIDKQQPSQSITIKWLRDIYLITILYRQGTTKSLCVYIRQMILIAFIAP